MLVLLTRDNFVKHEFATYCKEHQKDYRIIENIFEINEEDYE